MIVLLHGFTHTGASWQSVLATLNAGQRAITPDIRGHGGASERRPVTLAAVIDDLRKIAPERFTLVGYSMGGRIALHAALADPARVERLVLIGASPGIEDPAGREARRAADAQLAAEIERSSIEEFATSWAERTPVLAGQPSAVRAATHADRLRSTPAGLARALRGLGAGALPSLWGRLGELAMPVTIVVGERDSKFRTIAEQMAIGVGIGEVVVVPGAGHAVHLEAPPAVAAIIVSC
jgi:2-succinyl-6-hydroxy-2,4-cyclohexadiene-1-carboxylate synthase